MCIPRTMNLLSAALFLVMALLPSQTQIFAQRNPLIPMTIPQDPTEFYAKYSCCAQRSVIANSDTNYTIDFNIVSPAVALESESRPNVSFAFPPEYKYSSGPATGPRPSFCKLENFSGNWSCADFTVRFFVITPGKAGDTPVSEVSLLGQSCVQLSACPPTPEARSKQINFGVFGFQPVWVLVLLIFLVLVLVAGLTFVGWQRYNNAGCFGFRRYPAPDPDDIESRFGKSRPDPVARKGNSVFSMDWWINPFRGATPKKQFRDPAATSDDEDSSKIVKRAGISQVVVEDPTNPTETASSSLKKTKKRAGPLVHFSIDPTLDPTWSMGPQQSANAGYSTASKTRNANTSTLPLNIASNGKKRNTLISFANSPSPTIPSIKSTSSGSPVNGESKPRDKTRRHSVPINEPTTRASGGTRRETQTLNRPTYQASMGRSSHQQLSPSPRNENSDMTSSAGVYGASDIGARRF